MIDQIIDANVNRLAEGARVLEEYARFYLSDVVLTQYLKTMRHEIGVLFPTTATRLHSRSTAEDVRATELPPKRADLRSLLLANCKRVQESLRVLEEYGGSEVCNRYRYQMYDNESRLLSHLDRPTLMRGIIVISESVPVLLAAVAEGCAMVQLRDKTATKEQVYNKAQAFIAKRDSADVPFIINDYPDIAQVVQAEGVHTGQDDIPVRYQRQLLGPSFIIGRSTHSLEQGRLAQADGADYVSVGPLWSTPSKPGREAIGFEYLAQAHTLDVPYVAIGGIDRDRCEHVMAYNPPLLGIIRAHEALSELNVRYFS